MNSKVSVFPVVQEEASGREITSFGRHRHLPKPADQVRTRLESVDIGGIFSGQVQCGQLKRRIIEHCKR